MKRFYSLLTFVLLSFSGYAGKTTIELSYRTPGDSIGSETINGQVFVLYKVAPQETLYGISNQYKVAIEDIVKHNPQLEAGLKEGDILRVPYNKASKVAGSMAEHMHTVEPKETLYSISKRYNVSVDDLKKWNGLVSNEISPGDRIKISGGSSTTPATTSTNQPTSKNLDYSGKIVHTVEEQETLYSISKMYDATVEDIRMWNKLATDNLGIGQKLIVGTTQGLPDRKGRNIRDRETDNSRPKDYGYNSNPMSISQIGDPSQEELETSNSSGSASGVRKVTELGMATSIADSLNTKKYLALHRTAPIGTIMQVHNEMNNLSVFVRVVGKMPSTSENDKVLIKLSRKAYEKLGAYGDKVPVRLSYVP